MAAWRKKAYELFDCEPGAYSSARGKVELFADLVALARVSLEISDEQQLSRICEYVTWAARQHSDEIESALDLAFFLPVIRDQYLCDALRSRISVDVFVEKEKRLTAID